MGNRCYMTIKQPNGYSKNYYMHWNGGLDTIAPFCRALFNANIKDISRAIAFLKHLELRPEESEAAFNDEENGLYIIDLSKQTLEQDFNGNRQWHPHLKEAFESYVKRKIIPEYQDKVRSDYWNGILKAADEFFKEGAA